MEDSKSSGEVHSELESMVDPKKKIRIEFRYDPDYPAALIIVSGMKEPGE